MNINITKIGEIELEYGQSDEYFLIEEKDMNDLDLQELDSFLFDRFAYESHQEAGGAFCTMIYSVHTRWSKDKAIATMCHRLDV